MDFDYAVIGAGVVGLAIAAVLAPRGSLVVLEKADRFGTGTSSRNSEVVHAGLYYSPGSLKARLCIEGRSIIEELAARERFGYRRIGKYIVATNERERNLLTRLKENAEACGAHDIRWADTAELQEKEPDVRAIAALFSPFTGIVDSHAMMNYFRTVAGEAGADFAYDAEVTAVRSLDPATARGGYSITVFDGTMMSARCVINSAGLYADRVAAMTGIDVRNERLELSWSRGVYYGIASEANLHVKHLVYPVPDTERASLGVHACVDLGGGVKFGPTAEPLREKRENYDPPHDNTRAVAEGLAKYFPNVSTEHLFPVMVGIRPKLSRPSEPIRDFYIREESSRGLPGFVNLIGIESPGLTASPAIARYVAGLLRGAC